MKIKEILLAQSVLRKYDKEKLPFKLAYAISRNIIKMQNDLEAYEKTKAKLLSEHADLSHDEAQWIFKGAPNEEMAPEEKEACLKNQQAEIEKFNQEIAEIVEEEAEIQPYKVKLSVFSTVDPTPEDLRMLDWMVFDDVTE